MVLIYISKAGRPVPVGSTRLSMTAFVFWLARMLPMCA
jgi:hypothetical protein